jgi:hypothetical protein
VPILRGRIDPLRIFERKPKILLGGWRVGFGRMAEERCAKCGGELESGFLSTSNGSGLFWSREASATRLRPHDMEVVVPTGFSGTFSANLGGTRCRACGTFHLRAAK